MLEAKRDPLNRLNKHIVESNQIDKLTYIKSYIKSSSNYLEKENSTNEENSKNGMKKYIFYYILINLSIIYLNMINIFKKIITNF